MTLKTKWTMALGMAAMIASTNAWAGGFEEPGIGAEAMGRGGAFAAKADDGTALEYNIAGFARQRGTRITIDGKLTLNHDDFTRTGTYPGAAGSTAWAGQPFPKISSNNLGVAPFVAISTDFNYFERWTFAVGLNTPSAAASDRVYPKTVNGNWPSPGRYDGQEVNLLVVYPMLAAAVRVTKMLDVGLALQMVYGNFNLSSTSYADAGASICGPTPENTSCDAALNIKTSGFSATGVLGLMLHPIENLSLAANLRGPMQINSSGTVVAQAGSALPPLDPGTAANPAKATLPFRLPWVARFGARYAFLDSKKRERGDIEVDGTYETWHEAEGNGDQLKTKLSVYPIDATIVHHYKDTGSIRVGGAYNIWFANDSVLALRLGFFYDSAATSDDWTRLDFDTMAKFGYTLGLGYKIRGVKINVAYNYIDSSQRNVENGQQHIVNGLPASPGTAGGTSNAPGGGLEPVYNNGKYGAHTQALFLGLGFDVDQIQKKKRVLTY